MRIFLLILFFTGDLLSEHVCRSAADDLALTVKSFSAQDTEDKLKKIIKTCPNLADANYNLGVFYLDHNNFAESENFFLKAVEQRGDREDLLALAVVRLKLENLPEAKSSIDKVLKLDPNNPKALSLAAYLAFQADDFEAAIKLFEKAYELDKNESNASNLAIVKLKLNQAKQGLEILLDYRRSEKSQGLDQEIALFYALTGEFESCYRYLEEPKDLSGEYLRLRQLCLLQDGKLTGLNLDGDSVLSAFAYVKANNWTEAINYIKNQDNYRSNEDLVVLLGYSYEKTGNFQGAETVYREYLAENPTAIAVNPRLIAVLRSQQKNDEANQLTRDLINFNKELAPKN